MAQISRPFQVALAAAGLLVVVWFVALRGHSSSSASTAGSASAPASTASSSSSPGSPSSAYHGSAPGVEGLTKDIQKAHGAVAQSERNAAQLEQKSAQASGESAPAKTHSPGSAPARKAARTKGAGSSTAKHSSSGTSGQAWVEHQLSQKVTVALLFYSAHSYDDSRTRRELQRLIGAERARHEKIALRVATPEQVGTYGSFTRIASVYQTPTLLLVTPRGEVKPPITGLTDAFSIEQAIDEKTQP